MLDGKDSSSTPEHVRRRKKPLNFEEELIFKKQAMDNEISEKKLELDHELQIKKLEFEEKKLAVEHEVKMKTLEIEEKRIQSENSNKELLNTVLSTMCKVLNEVKNKKD